MLPVRGLPTSTYRLPRFCPRLLPQLSPLSKPHYLLLPPPAQGRERIGKLVPYLFNFRSRGNNIHRARSDTKRHTHLSDGYCSLPLESIGKLAFLYPPVKPPYSSPLFIPIAANESTPIFLFSPPKPSFLYHPLTPLALVSASNRNQLETSSPPPPIPYQNENILYQYQVTITIQRNLCRPLFFLSLFENDLGNKIN